MYYMLISTSGIYSVCTTRPYHTHAVYMYMYRPPLTPTPQVFIAEPEMVKLVHFQGYPEQLLPVVVAGVPSMHICLKFIPELVTQPDTQKQVP